MTSPARAPRLSARLRALNEAAKIAEERAQFSRATIARMEREYPNNTPIQAAERGVAMECELIARLIRERMQNRRAKP